MKAEKLIKLESQVYNILLNYKKTRDDDMLLYWYYVIFSLVLPYSEDYNLNDYYFSSIFSNPEFRVQLGIAPFSSVERARRKVQEKHPELQSERIKRIREIEEQEYLKYVKEN